MKETIFKKISGSFGWLNVTQFLGALNDNMFKLLLIIYFIAKYGREGSGSISAMAAFVFVLPFLLFSAWAGVLADRLSKRSIIVKTKVAELVTMSFGLISFYLQWDAGLYLVLFLMAAQSAFFGPSKYGIMPELVGKERLSKANGIIQAATFLAIILGTAFAPFLSQISSRNFVFASSICVMISGMGVMSSLGIEKTKAIGSSQKASWFFIRDIWRSLFFIRKDRYLWLAVVASAYFLFLGAFLQINLIPYGVEFLNLSEESAGYLFLFAAFGIGLGSLLAGWLSGRNVELGIVPFGAFGLMVTSFLLGGADHHLHTIRFIIFLSGLSAGLFIVPLQAWIQFRSPEEKRGEILAASGFLSWVGVLMAAALIYFFDRILALPPHKGFIIMGILTLILMVSTLYVLLDFFVRFIALLIMRMGYKVDIVGLEHVPLEGPALLVCNHVSYIDALLLNASQQRRIRFMMGRDIYDRKWLKPIFRFLKVIPISFKDSPKQLVASFKNAQRAMDDGYMVCIFAEGAITRTGSLREFKSGFEKIVKNTNYPIIPVYIGGAWGSIFSYYHGRPLAQWPTSLRYPISVHFGDPLPSTTAAADVRQAVMELSCDYFDTKKKTRKSLGEEFVHTARKNWSRLAITDITRKLSYGKTLVSAMALSYLLKKKVGDHDKVGILLPPSVGGVISNLAVSLMGKIIVNLNYTMSEKTMQECIQQCNLTSIISSKRFIDKMDVFASLPGLVFIEDIVREISLKDKWLAYLKSRLYPRRWLAGCCGFSPDDTATIIFSSGSTGQPKGVMLSHHNIISNIESSRAMIHPSPRDQICGVLPFFHSFGFTVTLWLPLLSGFSAVYHMNPLEGSTIAGLIKKNKSTLLFATPTFLLAYLRKAKKEDFASLRFVITGAEKLKKRLADAFYEKFEVRPLEGYGTTECSPVVSLNIPSVRSKRVTQVDHKEGSVGAPVTGVAVKIVHPNSGDLLTSGEEGLMLVKGPNVMRGYLNRPEETDEVLKDGWYNTGDIAHVDKDGFITITDRLSRFSKIGGEMIPHIAIEDVFHNALKSEEPYLAVTAIPDEKKGEKIVVLHTEKAGSSEELASIIDKSDLPNLWKPAHDAYHQIDELPILGSGKMDYQHLKKVALKEFQEISQCS
jgi:acyl-[acyl-carrier-protein]-phospholipid O-acyltransferase/long-chain-fatty-acid--[acyl-carrier-protein] ligase